MPLELPALVTFFSVAVFPITCVNSDPAPPGALLPLIVQFVNRAVVVSPSFPPPTETPPPFPLAEFPLIVLPVSVIATPL